MTAPYENSQSVLLAIDPGARSGFAIVGYSSGSVTTHEERCAVVWLARQYAVDAALPFVIVAESHTRFGKWGASAAAGMAAQRGRWQVAIDAAHLEDMPRLGRAAAFRGVVRVQSNEWYAALCGSRRDPRDVRLARAKMRAKVSDADEACAVCIGQWALRSDAVWSKLPVKFQGNP